MALRQMKLMSVVSSKGSKVCFTVFGSRDLTRLMLKSDDSVIWSFDCRPFDFR